jgi:hypothetical protein
MRKRFAFGLLVVGIMALGGPTVTSASMTQSSLNFGTVRRSVMKNVTYDDTAGVDQAAFVYLGNGAQATAPFSLAADACTGTMLGAGPSGCGISVRFDAGAAHPGLYTSTLTIRLTDTNGSTSTESIPLSGTAVAIAAPWVSAVSLSPTRYAPAGPGGARGDAVFAFTAGLTHMQGWPAHGARIAASIHSARGALVRRWWIQARAPAVGAGLPPYPVYQSLSHYTEVWNGADSHDRAVPAGVYSFRVSVYFRGHLVRSKPRLITVVG